VNCTANLDNRALPRAPAWSGSLSWQHFWDLADGALVTAKLETQFSGRYLTDYSPGLPQQNAYALGNARLTYDAPSGKWSLSAYLNNLASAPVLLQSNFSGPNPYAFGSINTPRTYGVIGSARF
jgi:iron complex outermembrane receptor protein